MERNPIQNDVRKAQRQRKLPPAPICMFCPERDPVALEKHHVVRHDNDEKLTVVVCKNCHAKHHEELLHIGVPLVQPPDRPHLEILVTILRALGVLFQELAAACARWADDLYADIQMLDTQLPQWRALVGAGASG